MNIQHYLQGPLNQKGTGLVEMYSWGVLKEKIYDLSGNIFN